MASARSVFVAVAYLVACAAFVQGAPDEPPAPTGVPFNPCPVCKMAVAMLEQQLTVATDLTKTVTETVMQACGVVGPAENVCKLVMAEYAGLFGYGMSVAKFSMDGFCTGVFMCPPESYQMMTQNGIFETTCNVCKATMTAVLQSLGSEALQKQTAQTIQLICSAPLVDKDQCMATFGAALAQSMQVTAAILEPETFCTMFGPCLVSSVTPGKPTPSPTTESHYVSRRGLIA